MTRLTSAQFMLALPTATRALLPRPLQKFKAQTRSWLCQLYYTDPHWHYEVWNMGERRGVLELGLHFESKDAQRNLERLQHFARHLIEVKATLGTGWEAEQWDKGWTKVYETIPYQPFSTDLVAQVAQRLAQAMQVLEALG